MEIVYESKRPRIYIAKDQWNRQWLLGSGICLAKGRRPALTHPSYHPTLSLLLEELAEQFFRKNTKKLKELKDLDKSIIKTYQLIEKVAKSLKGGDNLCLNY